MENEDFKIACPHCGQHLAFDPSMFDQSFECPSCGKPVRTPPKPEPPPADATGTPDPDDPSDPKPAESMDAPESSPDSGQPAVVIETVRRGDGGERRRRRLRTIGVAAGVVVAVLGLSLCIRSCRKKPSKPSPSRPAAERTTPPSGGGGREFIRNHIRENGNCRVVSLTKRGGDVVVCDRNDWAAQRCPRDMTDALRQAADEYEKIVDVTITEGGRWLVLWGKNAGAWRGIPPGLESALRTFNREGETIYSATFNDSGDWIAISDEHYNAAGSIADWLADGARKFGILRAACVSENAAVAVFDGGYKFFGPVPEDLKAALRKTHLDVRIVKIAGSAWFFADEYGSYQFNM